MLAAVLATMTVGACDSPSAPDAATGPGLDPDGVLAAMSSARAAVTGRVTGSAHREFDGKPIILSFSATQRADGTVSGQYFYHAVALNQRLHVSVTCMSIVGNQAFVAGTIVDASPNLAFTIGTVSYFYTRDNGEGANADPDEVSLVRANDVPEAAEEFCTERPELLPNREVLHGNVNVAG
jgi:hypothetical protein